MDLTFKDLNNQDNKAWKLKRIGKGIKLSGDLAKYVNCTHSLISMYENEKAPMAANKIERYKAFIEAYPDEPKLVADIK